MKYILIIFTFIFIASLHGVSTKIPSSYPLGITADGQYLWIGDAKSAMLYGYNIQRGKFIKEKKVSLPGLRDFTFYNNKIITVLKNRIYEVDPITGDIVRKQILKKIKNAISIAHHKKLIYIYDAKSMKIWRYDFKKNIFLGSFKAPAKKLRGMAFYRDSLWLTCFQKDNKKYKSTVFKVNPLDGSILAALNLKEEIFGLTLLEGKIHISAKQKIFEFDIQENDNFITFNPSKILVTGNMVTKALWSKKQVVIQESLKTTFSGFPLNPRQLPKRIKMTPRYKKRKILFAGDSQFTIGFQNSQQSAVNKIKLKVKLREINYTFNNKNIYKFKPKKPESKELLRYLNYNSNQSNAMNLAKEFRNLSPNNWHPYQAIQNFYQKKSTISPIELITYLRKLGIPARKANIWHTKINKMIMSVEFYCDPMGWIIISHLYSPSLPKFFPVPNTWLSIDYPESVIILPKPLTKDLKPIRIPKEVIRWNLNIEIIK